jgi:hypothetical protein
MKVLDDIFNALETVMSIVDQWMAAVVTGIDAADTGQDGKMPELSASQNRVVKGEVEMNATMIFW